MKTQAKIQFCGGKNPKFLTKIKENQVENCKNSSKKCYFRSPNSGFRGELLFIPSRNSNFPGQNLYFTSQNLYFTNQNLYFTSLGRH